MTGEFMEINNTGITDISLSKTVTVTAPLETPSDGVNKALSVNSQSVELSLSKVGKLTQQLDQTSMEIDNILASHLSNEQQKSLNDIYQKLDKAFEADSGSPGQEQKIENLFEQAHNILETSVDKLSTREREQVDSLVNKMDYLEQKLSNVEQADVSGLINISGSVQQQNDSEVNVAEMPTKKKKTLSVAELNALSAAELNKLPPHLLKRLNAQQLNKLNASQLSLLPENLLSKLTPSNLAKVSGS